MSTPKSLPEILTALRAERHLRQAQLDAIDLAIENLQRVWPEAPPTRKTRPSKRQARAAGDSSEAETRRQTVLALITKAENGATIADLRRWTPRMGAKDRSNAIQQLKAQKKIQRAGNAWKAAA